MDSPYLSVYLFVKKKTNSYEEILMKFIENGPINMITFYWGSGFQREFDLWSAKDQKPRGFDQLA